MMNDGQNNHLFGSHFGFLGLDLVVDLVGDLLANLASDEGDVLLASGKVRLLGSSINGRRREEEVEEEE